MKTEVTLTDPTGAEVTALTTEPSAATSNQIPAGDRPPAPEAQLIGPKVPEGDWPL